jgi:tetratricopeptide (TPR) repeat protein
VCFVCAFARARLFVQYVALSLRLLITGGGLETLRPSITYAVSEHALGVTLKMLGRFQSAAHHYRRALRLSERARDALPPFDAHSRGLVQTNVHQFAHDLARTYRPSDKELTKRGWLAEFREKLNSEEPRNTDEDELAAVLAKTQLSASLRASGVAPPAELLAGWFTDGWLRGEVEQVQQGYSLARKESQRGLRMWHPATIRWVPRTCAGCGRAEARPSAFRSCSRCLEAMFCTAECQRSVWPRHKTECNRIAAQRAAAGVTAKAPPPPPPPPVVEHEPDEPAVSPIRRLMADVLCADLPSARASLDALRLSCGDDRAAYAAALQAHLFHMHAHAAGLDELLTPELLEVLAAHPWAPAPGELIRG